MGWYSGNWKQRTEITIHGHGVEKANSVVELDGYYGNHCPITSDGSFEWFSRPCWTLNGKTYTLYYASTKNVEIKQFDEITKASAGPVVLGASAYVDDHTCGSGVTLQYQQNASMNGKILVVWSAFGSNNNGIVYSRRSKNVESIGTSASDWESTVTVYDGPDVGASYPQIVERADGVIMVIYRECPDSINQWYYIRLHLSMDGGNSWSEQKTIMSPDASYRKIYDMVDINADHDKVHFMFSEQRQGTPIAGRAQYLNLYHAYLDTDGVSYEVEPFSRAANSWTYHAQVTNAQLVTGHDSQANHALQMDVGAAMPVGANLFAGMVDSPALDLSEYAELHIWLKSTLALASGTLQLRLGESGGTNVTPLLTAIPADTWTEVAVDLSNIATANRDAIIALGVMLKIDVGAFTLTVDDLQAVGKWKQSDGTVITPLPATRTTVTQVMDSASVGNAVWKYSNYAVNNGAISTHLATQFTSPAGGGVIRYVGVTSRYDGTATGKVSLYSDSGDKAYQPLKANNAAQNIIIGGNVLDLGSEYELAGSTKYWIIVKVDQAAACARASSGGVGKTAAAVFADDWPADLSGESWSAAGAEYGVAVYPVNPKYSSVDCWDYLWDIRVFDDVPYLISVGWPGAADMFAGTAGVNYHYPGKVLRHYWDGDSWVTDFVTSTGDSTGTSGSGSFSLYMYQSGAVFGIDKDTIFTTPYTSLADRKTTMQKWTAVAGTPVSWNVAENITQANPGYCIRPQWVKGATAASLYQMLFAYTEYYYFTGANQWDEMLHAYPGFNNEHYIKFSENCRTDFGDLRFTAADGQTVVGSLGRPFIEQKVDSWRAILQVGPFTDPGDGNDLTLYCYFENPAAENANDKTVIRGVFPQACTFDGDAIDETVWEVQAGAVGVADGNLVLTGIVTPRGLIQYKAFQAGPVEVRARLKSKANTYILGACEDDGYLTNRMILAPGSTADRMAFLCTKDGSGTSVNIEGMDTANWHIWSLRWLSTSLVEAWRDSDTAVTTKALAKQGEITDSTYIPDGTLALLFRESDQVDQIGYVDWVWMKPCQASAALEPTVTVKAGAEYTPQATNAIFFGCNF